MRVAARATGVAVGAPSSAEGDGQETGQGGPPLGARLSTAALLIGKAQGSAYPSEQESLALRAYRELAAYLNSVQPPDLGGRRRERRLLTDRRGGKRRTDPKPPVIDLRLDQARAAYRAAAPQSGPVGSHLDLGL